MVLLLLGVFVVRLLNKFGIQRMFTNFINIVMHVHIIIVLINLNEVLVNALLLNVLNHELLLMHLFFS